MPPPRSPVPSGHPATVCGLWAAGPLPSHPGAPGLLGLPPRGSRGRRAAGPAGGLRARRWAVAAAALPPRLPAGRGLGGWGEAERAPAGTRRARSGGRRGGRKGGRGERRRGGEKFILGDTSPGRGGGAAPPPAAARAPGLRHAPPRCRPRLVTAGRRPRVPTQAGERGDTSD